MIDKIIAFISQPLINVVGGWQARKTMAAQSAQAAIVNQLDIDKAVTTAKIQRITSQDNADIAYDLMVLENRKKTYADDVIQLFFLCIIIMHFIPKTQPYMFDGWAAIDKAPWWFQFGIVGILISTLGLMRIFRMWTEQRFTLQGALKK